MANPSPPMTVGDILSSMFGDKAPPLPEVAKQRLIAMPPEVISDKKAKLLKIRLADGKYLNIHVVSANPKNL